MNYETFLRVEYSFVEHLCIFCFGSGEDVVVIVNEDSTFLGRFLGFLFSTENAQGPFLNVRYQVKVIVIGISKANPLA